MKLIFSLFVLFSLSLFVGSCNNKYSKILKSNDFEYKLKMANEYYSKKEYSKAKELYTELMNVYKSTDKFEDLYYKMAYCEYHMKNYLSAQNLFKEFLSVFPNSKYAEELLFMEAYCFYKEAPRVELEQTDTKKAIAMFQDFLNTYPNSTRVEEANKLIDECRNKLEEKEYNAAALYYKIGQFKAAQVAFNQLCNDFVDSKKIDFYKYMAIKSGFEYANLSIFAKQKERLQVVIESYQDFIDRFEESSYKPMATKIYQQALEKIKLIDNEQDKTTSRG